MDSSANTNLILQKQHPLTNTKNTWSYLLHSITFNQYILNIKNKISPRLNVLKLLANTTFGQNKETMTTVHKLWIRSVMEDTNPAWAPNLATTHLTLQTIQNWVPKIITGHIKKLYRPYSPRNRDPQNKRPTQPNRHLIHRSYHKSTTSTKEHGNPSTHTEKY